jgi:hypothetical protein
MSDPTSSLHKRARPDNDAGEDKNIEPQDKKSKTLNEAVDSKSATSQSIDPKTQTRVYQGTWHGDHYHLQDEPAPTPEAPYRRKVTLVYTKDKKAPKTSSFHYIDTMYDIQAARNKRYIESDLAKYCAEWKGFDWQDPYFDEHCLSALRFSEIADVAALKEVQIKYDLIGEKRPPTMEKVVDVTIQLAESHVDVFKIIIKTENAEYHSCQICPPALRVYLTELHVLSSWEGGPKKGEPYYGAWIDLRHYRTWSKKTSQTSDNEGDD